MARDKTWLQNQKDGNRAALAEVEAKRLIGTFVGGFAVVGYRSRAGVLGAYLELQNRRDFDPELNRHFDQVFLGKLDGTKFPNGSLGFWVDADRVIRPEPIHTIWGVF
jgi:hypothetical protein